MHFHRISNTHIHTRTHNKYQSQRAAVEKYLKMHKNKIFIEREAANKQARERQAKYKKKKM